MIISASEIRDFLRCRVRWYWRHQVRIVPQQKPVALAFGGLGHDILGKWYALDDKQRTVKRMKKIAKAVLLETRPEELTLKDFELLEAMTVGYSAWAKPRDRELGMTSTRSELFFEEPLVPDRSILVRGFIDVAFEPKAFKNTVGCLEHKFKKTIDTSVVDLNLQLSVYMWALRRLFPKKKRYIAYYNLLRKQMPGPRVRADLFARESIERTEEEIQQWEEDTQRICRDMLDAAIYPNPQDSCSWDCDYQAPCTMRGRPGDLEATFISNYVNKDGTELELDDGN